MTVCRGQRACSVDDCMMKRMYVYLDESGDTGFKFHRGSSKYFVIALLLVDDPVPLHQAIHDVRLSLGKPETYEFKFTHAHHTIRQAFFHALRPYPFTVRALVVDKQRLEAPHLRKKGTFYNYLVKMALKNDFGTISNATLVIDESFQGKGPKAGLAAYLRHELNAESGGSHRKIEAVRYHQSHKDNLIQAADMIVGAIAREYEEKDAQYRHMLTKKIGNIWVFPR